MRECKNDTKSQIICAPKEEIDSFIDDVFVDAIIITDELDVLSQKMNSGNELFFQ